MLKLDVAFLYDLLGASQEHKIKPKKFAQTDIDEVILGHSVAGAMPIAYRCDGTPGWTTLEQAATNASSPTRLAWKCWPTISPPATPTWTPVRGAVPPSLYR